MPIKLAHMAMALEQGMNMVRHHDDDSRFNENTKDPDWLRLIGEDNLGWIVVSGDSKILKKALERQALSIANVTFFVMEGKSWLHTKLPDYVWKFFKVWPDIKENAKITVPSIFEVGGGRGLNVTCLGKTKS
jgi:hypothetical protein